MVGLAQIQPAGHCLLCFEQRVGYGELQWALALTEV